MSDWRARIASIDWSRLRHAYGWATDTPAHLHALVGEDPAARDAALDHLWQSVLHQGTAWTCTGEVAMIVGEMVLDPGAAAIRRQLVAFIAHVARAFDTSGATRAELEAVAAFDLESIDDGPGDTIDWSEMPADTPARPVIGRAGAADHLGVVADGALSSEDAVIRAYGAMMAVSLLARNASDDERQALEGRLAGLAMRAGTDDERCAHVMALGALGVAPAAFLRHASRAVRVCAALAPALASDDAATEELLSALEHHAAEIEDWFETPPPQFDLHPRFAVVSCVIERVPDFDRLEPAATAVARETMMLAVDLEWGPLLHAAFGHRPGSVATEAQRRFLRALVENADLWDPIFGNPGRWFDDAGLPYDRDACAALLGD